MLIAEALRALAPFSLVAGEPVFRMFSRAISSAHRSPKAVSGAANDGQLGAQVHCFKAASAAALRSGALQLSLIADERTAEPQHTEERPAETPAQRPIDRIRRPRKPGIRRRMAAPTPAPAPVASTDFVAVQRCRAQAANDSSITMYWAKPNAVQGERGMRWAMTGSMADIFAELERLERLELQHARG